MKFTRLACGDVTEALVSATEQADAMSNVLVLYEGKDGKVGGVICNAGITRKDANFLCDQFKAYLFQNIREE